MRPSARRVLASGMAAGFLGSTITQGIVTPASATLSTGSDQHLSAAGLPETLRGQRPAGARGGEAGTQAQPAAQVGSGLQQTAEVVSEPASTPLAVTIDDVSSVDIAPGEPVEVSGVVSNPSDSRWTDAQVYLTMTPEPATTKSELDAFDLIEGGFGIPVEKYGRFDEIGPLLPGEEKPYSLSVPFARLPINQTPGVYHMGVIVLAGTRDGRDTEADARVDTLMPLLPVGTTDKLAPTRLLTLLPLSAPVSRYPDGAFTDESLAAAVGEGGRLRNVLNFALSVPANTVELVADPAVLQACRDMAAGYVVREGRGSDAVDTRGDADSSRVAADWIADLEAVSARQGLTLLPWGSPASSALTDADMPTVIEAAVLAGQTFAAETNLNGAITNWPNKGLSTRRGLARTRSAGAAVQVVSQVSLPAIRDKFLEPDTYPPAQVTLGTTDGPLRAIVTRPRIGGVAFTPTVDMLQLRQSVAAEAAIRAMSSSRAQTSVLAAPLRWNPSDTDAAEFGSVYGFAPLSATSLADAGTFTTAPYTGPVRLPKNARASFPLELSDKIAELRIIGEIFVGLLAGQRRVSLEFTRELASAGSFWGQNHPNRATALIRQSKRDKAAQVSKVTLTGPSFVTFSSKTGRFPLTVSNGLDIPVTVMIDVVAQDPDFQIEPLKPIVLEPGRQRDVEVVSRANGSGLTAVRARLSTASQHPFGKPVAVDVRATQIGLVIWLVFGLAAAVIVVASILRIYRRIRTTGFRPRGQLPA
ncbi:MAG: hypothetical protein H0T14_04090 [Nocardioidaceae bacterium]|nr:hypothetical protein [Nocardioidaceae bacterium]